MLTLELLPVPEARARILGALEELEEPPSAQQADGHAPKPFGINRCCVALDVLH